MIWGYDHQGFGEVPGVAPIIAGGLPQVLPRLERPALCDLLRRLPPDELDDALRTKLFRAVNLPGMVLHVACGPAALDEARRKGLALAGYGSAEDLLAAARAVHGAYLLQRATFGLVRRWPDLSASRRMSAAQAVVGCVVLAALMLAGLQLSPGTFIVLLSLISGLFFLAVVALRVLCIMPPVARRRPAAPRLPDEALPAYSVLAPLFRETGVLRQLLTALSQLDYPAEKLDIKLILEEADIVMQRALADFVLDARFEIIIVPAGLPQTKPRALNYALQFCRGDLVTIYDAEDIPEPDQLRRAAERFAAAPPDLACLQAQLTFYNPDENWLTRQFTAEYAALFGVLLPMLTNHGLPFLLGGTSNHFRAAILRKVGAWDPFNVTEDADLGLRLARQGYETAAFGSLTYEEANTQLPNWMRQRARWLKGFLVTWLVHMRSPLRLLRELGPAGFWAMQAMTIGIFASALLHPLCMLLTLAVYATHPVVPDGAGLALILLAGLNLFILLSGYGLAIVLTRRGLRRRGIRGWAGTLAAMPLYWLLMSAAAWMAVWQFIMAPFHWNKTVHGLSKMQQPVRRYEPRERGRAPRRSSHRS
jgi:cellulose synthase/poly-beta-1,6-N-acetylglucosamine synthase-like glycosyltransferase